MIRPVDLTPSQHFGENPTRNLPWDSWLIQTFGNYQPDGHSGIDYPCDLGTPVRAVTSGTVLHIGRMGGSYADNPWWIAPGFAGYCAVIDHGSFIGIYGHCQDGSAKVRKGDRVTEGQVFILSGNTGGSTGPHLHFEILPDGYILNSAFYGRINPASLFTGSLTHAGTTTTPLEDLKGFLMALTDAQQNDIYWQLCTPEGRQAAADLAGAAAARHTLNAPITRGGAGAGIGDGRTSLAALVAWNDDHTIQTLAAIAAASAQAGATVDEIQAAVKEALKSGVVKVEVSVEGAK